MSPLALILALAVTVRITCWAAHANPAHWRGRQIIYFGLALSLGLIVGGAWALALGSDHGGATLLAGTAMLLLINRRSPFRTAPSFRAESRNPPR